MLRGGEGTIHAISGMDKIQNLPSLVCLDQVLYEGYHYKSDRTVDKPVLSVSLVVDDMKQMADDVNYINSVFTVVDDQGKSLLKEKFNPIFI